LTVTKDPPGTCRLAEFDGSHHTRSGCPILFRLPLADRVGETNDDSFFACPRPTTNQQRPLPIPGSNLPDLGLHNQPVKEFIFLRP